jgi:hypothetical protein
MSRQKKNQEELKSEGLNTEFQNPNPPGLNDQDGGPGESTPEKKPKTKVAAKRGSKTRTSSTKSDNALNRMGFDSRRSVATGTFKTMIESMYPDVSEMALRTDNAVHSPESLINIIKKFPKVHSKSRHVHDQVGTLSLERLFAERVYELIQRTYPLPVKTRRGRNGMITLMQDERHMFEMPQDVWQSMVQLSLSRYSAMRPDVAATVVQYLSENPDIAGSLANINVQDLFDQSAQFQMVRNVIGPIVKNMFKYNYNIGMLSAPFEVLVEINDFVDSMLDRSALVSLPSVGLGIQHKLLNYNTILSTEATVYLESMISVILSDDIANITEHPFVTAYPLAEHYLTADNTNDHFRLTQVFTHETPDSNHYLDSRTSLQLDDQIANVQGLPVYQKLSFQTTTADASYKDVLALCAVLFKQSPSVISTYGTNQIMTDLIKGLAINDPEWADSEIVVGDLMSSWCVDRLSEAGRYMVELECTDISAACVRRNVESPSPLLGMITIPNRNDLAPELYAVATALMTISMGFKRACFNTVRVYSKNPVINEMYRGLFTSQSFEVSPPRYAEMSPVALWKDTTSSSLSVSSLSSPFKLYRVFSDAKPIFSIDTKRVSSMEVYADTSAIDLYSDIDTVAFFRAFMDAGTLGRINPLLVRSEVYSVGGVLPYVQFDKNVMEELSDYIEGYDLSTNIPVNDMEDVLPLSSSVTDQIQPVAKIQGVIVETELLLSSPIAKYSYTVNEIDTEGLTIGDLQDLGLYGSTAVNSLRNGHRIITRTTPESVAVFELSSQAIKLPESLTQVEVIQESNVLRKISIKKISDTKKSSPDPLITE